MEDYRGEGNARRAKFSIFQWICILSKNIFQYLLEQLLPMAKCKKQTIAVKDNKVVLNMEYSIMFQMNLCMFLIIDDGNFTKELAAERTDVTKKKSCSWKPNKRIEIVFFIILYLLYLNLITTAKNHIILRWMISLMEIEDTSSTTEEDIAKSTNPSERKGGRTSTSRCQTPWFTSK
jgi:hypothetical protein